MVKNCIIKILISVLAFNSYAWGGQYYYIVKQNDTVSSILYKAQLKPIYKKSGYLQSVRKINSQISNLDRIRPGNKIFFSQASADKANLSGTMKILETGEMIFNLGNIKNDPNLAKQKASTDTQSQASEPTKPNLVLNPAVTQIETRTSEFSDLPQSEIKLAIGMGYSRIDSSQNNGSASFLSKGIPSTLIQWKQNWSSSWQSHACWEKYDIEFADTSIGKLESSRNVSTSSLGLGVTHYFESKLYLTSLFGISERIFAKSTASGTAMLQSKPISFLGFSVGKQILEVRHLIMSSEIGGKLLTNSSGGDFEVLSGFEYSAKVSVEHKLKNYTLFVSSTFSKLNQNTSQSDQGTTDLNSQFGVVIPLGGEEQ